MSTFNLLDKNLEISIIIPTLNRAKYLEKTLESLLTQNYSPDMFEIVIVDGGSTDNTKEICDRLIKGNKDYSICYIYEPEPGLLSGRHRGALESNGDILTFIDDDIEATPNWLSSIHNAFVDPNIHLVGGKNIPKFEVNPPLWLKDLWSTTSYGGKACGYLSLLDLGNKIQKIHPNYVWGLNFSIRKKTFFNVGGFNPDTYPKKLQRFQGDGETGLAMKLFDKGYEALYHPDIMVYHIIPAERMTIEYFEKRMYFQGVANSYSDIRKSIVSTKEDFSSKNGVKYLIKKYANKVVQIRLSNMTVYIKSSKEVRTIKKKMRQAYDDGYRFHQAQVKKDPTLLTWILKENYWDYHLKLDINDSETAGIMEKSY